MPADSPTIEQLFEEAMRCPAGPERRAFLDGACGGDAGLRERVEALLSAHEAAGAFLDQPALANGATLAAAPSEGPGTTVDRYKLLQLIGEGGFGVVYMAEQTEPVKRRVALKIIKAGMDTKQVIARFEAERQALALMDHPHIAKVLDAGATETGRPYFVMELVKGVPITEYCDTENLSTRQRLELFVQVCSAVQHAHQKGIIHRDLKPSNVMVTLHDGAPVPKVIDFGIAKATNTELTQKTLFTEYRQFVGTPEYMSPEQAEMSGLDIDTRSDIYSLGVLLYELLTGLTPFDGERLRSAALGEIQRIIREEEPPRPSTRHSTEDAARHRRTDPSSLSRQLRGDLDWIVMKALEKDRSRRYETANGFALDIGRYLSDEPVSAMPPSAAYMLKKLVRRNRGVFAFAAIVFLVLSLGVVGTTWGLVSATAEAQRAERELARANEVRQLITEMFTRIAPQHAQGADTSLLESILESTVKRLANGEIEDELIAAELHAVIGGVYQALDLYTEAERHLRPALEMFRRLLGEDARDTLWATTQLGMLYGTRGRYEEAEELFASNLDRCRRTLGETHPRTLLAMNNLASTYRNQGRYEQAERLLIALRDIQRRTPGSDSTIGGLARGNLYLDLSRLDEAESAYRELIDHMREVDRAEHPETISAMQNLGNVYRHQRRYAEAAAIYEDALELAGRVLGRRARTTTNIRANLGAVRLRQGRLEDAEALLDEALRGYQELFGNQEHPLTLNAKSILAGLRARQERFDEAEALYRQVIEGQKKVHGERDQRTLGTMTNFGIFLLGRQHHDEARVMLETSLAIKREELGGSEHLFTRIAMQNLADAYMALDRRADAVPLERELLEWRIGRAETEEATANALNEVAWDLLDHEFKELHDPARALLLAKRACRLEERAEGGSLWLYLDTLALAQHRTGDSAAALVTQERAMSLIPEGASERAVAEMQANLELFESAAESSSDRASGEAPPPLVPH